MPDVSIIIPVYNNQRTLARTLSSVRKQSHAGWEAIVIDDGSTDGSAHVAGEAVAQDPRIRLIQQPNAGAGAARNSGLASAAGDWVLFLDADDALSPNHLEVMLAEAARAPQAGLLHCGWRRWRLGELWWSPHPAELLNDPVVETARRCPFAIHSALTRREHIARAGGFDPALRIGEDWDLWQRIARLGVKFAPVSGVWAEVHVRPGSLSSDTARHLADGLAVIRRGHARSADEADLALASWHFAIWTAGAMVGRGGDPVPLLESVGLPVPPAINSRALVGILEDGLVVGACRAAPPWPKLWLRVAKGVTSIAEWMGQHGPALLGKSVMRDLETRIFQVLPTDASATIGGTRQESLNLGKGIPPARLPGVSRLRTIIRTGQRELARLDFPVFGALPIRTLAEEIVARTEPTELRDILFRRFTRGGMFLPWRGWQHTRDRWKQLRPGPEQLDEEELLTAVKDLLLPATQGDPHEEIDATIERMIAEEKDRSAATLRSPPPAPSAAPRTGPDEGEEVDYTSEEYWEGIYSNRDPWDYSNNYEALKYDQTIALLAGRRFGNALELACAEGEFTRRLAPLADRVLATDISPSAVARAAEKLADLANVATARLDILTEQPSETYDLIVCSEVLYYLDSAEVLAGVAAKVSAHLKPGGWFVTAHANLLVDEPDRTGFGWPHAFGGKGIGEGFAADPELQLAAEFRTSLYRILRFEKSAEGKAGEPERIAGDTALPLPRRIAAQVRWRGGEEIPVASAWNDFPVLMYHRIAEDGPADLAQWRTSPAAFESQLAWLRENGWSGVSLSRFERAVHWNQPLPERSVMLTFDDATQDFLQAALPPLHRYEFPATLFVPTDKVGQAADWDAAHGSPAPLLGWDEIDSLRHCDVAIAAHGAAHLPLTVVTSEEAVRDLARAKAVLAERLETPLDAIAYPFGAFDGFVRELSARAGYKFGFTCEAGLVHQASDPLVLPRQEVRGGIGLKEFAALLRR